MADFDRRRFLRIASGSAAAALLPQMPVLADEKQNRLPNILWISCEDISPDLGCYGDKYSVSPNIDKLAAQGVRYDNCFAHAGVCAPARSGIITGMYPSTIGTNQMRCKGVPPGYVKCFPEYLRAAGYYCTNNVKTDYQFNPPFTAWDESSKKAHWRNRAAGQPFFAVFNFTTSHESQIRNRSKGMLDRIEKLGPDKHNPARAKLPPYYPDTPEVRKDWAQYYDVITLMDKQVGDILKQLEEDGLAEDTIVWFWGDHGRGLPRAKRWLYDSGIHVPLIIRVPEKFRKLAGPENPDAFKPGKTNDDLVAFLDFAPTMLSLAGAKIPDYIQGRAFLGPQKAQPREYIFGARDRMDETYDCIRAVRDKRYKYICNYMPHLSRGQDIEYMNEMPTMQQMRKLHAAGELKGPQLQYFEPTKPVEELYDTKKDPHEVKNLADSKKHRKILERMRAVHEQWVRQTLDIGLIPEPLFDEMKWPGGEKQKTAEPVFWMARWARGSALAKGAQRVTIVCPTAGASIAYHIDSGDKKGPWVLYEKSIWLQPGRTLHAKACRIGFADSREVTFKTTDDVPAKRPQPPEADPEHWANKLKQTDLLERLRRIKQLDYEGSEAVLQYVKALADEYPAVRYWAVVGLHTNCASEEQKQKAQSELERLLKDPATVVRVAAAHALCDWGREDEGLSALTEALKDDNPKARLYAVTALKHIGGKARPALPQTEAALKDSEGYVQRVARTVVKQLEGN